MLFSFVIPVYNAERYIGECFDSIIAQTEQDFEVVAVNDGSTDCSGAICDEYSKKYPDKIKVIHIQNNGALLARRIGMERATGDYIWAIDSDDYLPDSNALSLIKEKLLLNPCDLVFFNASTGSGSQAFIYSQFKDGEIFTEKEKAPFYEMLVSSHSFNSLWNKVFKKALVDLEEDYTKHRDVVRMNDSFQLLPIITNATKLQYIDKVFYHYRNVAGSIVHRFNDKAYLAFRKKSIRLEEYLVRWDYPVSIDQIMKHRFDIVIEAIFSLEYLPKNERNGKGTKFLEYIKNDEFFLQAYHSSARDQLSIKRKVLLYLLIRQHYSTLYLVICSRIIRATNRVISRSVIVH